MKSGIQIRIAAGLVAAFTVLLVTMVVFYRTNRALIESSLQVEQAYEILSILDKLEVAIRNVETGQRGYVLTGKETFLEPHQNALLIIPGQLHRLQFLTSDNRELQRRMPPLSRAIQEKVDFSHEVIRIRRARGAQEAIEVVAGGRGRLLMEMVRTSLTEMRSEETKLLTERAAASRSSAARTERIMLFSLFLVLTLFLLVLLVLTRHLAQLSRAEAALQQNKDALENLSARLTAVLDSATQVAIIATDPQGLITVFNRGAELMLGYRADLVVGKMTPEIFHLRSELDARSKELSEELKRPVGGFDVFGEPARHGGYEQREWTYVRNDGWRLTVSLAVTALRDTRGNLHGFLGVVSDVSQRKEMEEALRSAKAAADDANRAKSEFLASMSHEIRSPLNAVIGMTDLALDTPLDKQQREYLQIVKTAGNSLLRLINDILDLSKIEARMFTLDAAVFDLREAIGNVMKTLAHQAHQKRLELVLGVDPAVPEFLVADEKRLCQVVLNLVGNAIKFTETGEVVVQVDLASGSDAETRLRFEIRDTGIGISKEKQQSIFEPFVQADSSTSRRYGGTGLGLTISEHLVRCMGGEIDLESAEGQGSAFSFTLSFATAQAPSRKRITADPTHLRGVTVFVVDDNATNLLLLGKMLTGWGMAPHLFGCPEEALKVLHRAGSERPCRLLITDLVMPSPMDGLSFVREVRRHCSPDEIGAVVLSSSQHSVSMALQEELGIAACIMKPAKPSELMDAVMTALGNFPIGMGKAANPAVTSAPGRVLRILLVEDNPVNQLLAVRLLEKKGHSIAVANDGREALAVLERESFDMALMDVRMPGMSGYEVTHRIRDRERELGGHLPIIAITADALQGDRERCLAEGMDGFVAKPVEPDELYRAISAALPSLTLRSDGSKIVSANEEHAQFDETSALRRAGGDPQVLREMAAIFLEQSPKLLADLHAAASSAHPGKLESAAHAIKGAIGHFSEGEVYQAAARLQRRGMENNLAGLEDDLVILERELNRLHGALTRQLAER